MIQPLNANPYPAHPGYRPWTGGDMLAVLIGIVLCGVLAWPGLVP